MAYDSGYNATSHLCRPPPTCSAREPDQRGWFKQRCTLQTREVNTYWGKWAIKSCGVSY